MPAEKIGRHESFHGMLDAYGEFTGRKTILDGILEELRKNFTPEQIESVLTKYHEALRGVYSADRNSMDQDILEEMLADAYAGINAFGAGATKFSEAVQGFMRDNHMSRETTQDNGTEQPTGPPSQNRTFQEEIEAQVRGEPAGQKENTAETGGERYFFEGYAEDGKGIYRSNFPKGTPKKAKGERILRYIQDVWSFKPITLRLEKDGVVRYIEAKFDPTYDEGENRLTDASKLMGGNRHGTAAEQRVTLDLADDYYRIASESRYNYSKKETGKDIETHKDVSEWHYFINDIYFAEFDSDEYEPYTVTINVKEKSSGHYVYSFSAERTEKNRESSTQQTLHAAVNGSSEATANGKSSIGSILNENENVKQQIRAVLDKVSPNHAEQMERYTELKDSDPEAAQRFYDGLMESQYRAEFEEYLKLTEELAGLEAKAGTAEDANADGDGAYTERASLDDSDMDVSVELNEVDEAGLEEELNSAGLNLSSKDNNKNNQRINAYIKEHHPNIGEVEFFNDKTTGYVTVKRIIPQSVVDEYEKREADRYAWNRRAERFRKRYLLAPLGIFDLIESIKKRLEKSGIDATVHRSRSTVGSKSFYIETANGQTIKLSDHNTVSQQMQHPDTYFVNLTEKASVDEVWDSVLTAIDKYEAGSTEHYSVDDADVETDRVGEVDAAKEKLIEALRKMSPQELMGDRVGQLIDQYTTQQKPKPQKPKFDVDRGNLRRALSSTLGLTKEQSAKLSEALDEYTGVVKPKRKPEEKKDPLDVESKPTEAKRKLRTKLLDTFSVPAGQRGTIGRYIDSFADRIVKNGKLTEADRKAFFAKMYDSGVMTVAADEYSAQAREYLKGGRIYVSDSVVADFGDDWENIRKRAFAAGIYLTRQRVTDGKQNAGIDVWNQDLAGELPWLFDPEATDRRSMLEQIVKVAEDGKEEQLSLAEYTMLLSEQEFTSEDEVLENLEKQMEWALRTFAETAQVEIALKDRSMRQAIKERNANKEAREKRKAAGELKELQQRTLKTLQWLNRNRHRAPEELKAAWDEVLGDIDIFAVGAANEMNWSDKYNATWKDLAQMYKDAMSSDPNFLPSAELERIVARLDATKIGDMDLGALQDLYKAAVGLRTEYYNRNNVINDEMQRLFAEVYTDSKREIESAPGGYTGKAMDKLFNLEQLHPMNYLQRMGGWDPNGAFYSMAKQLEKGERDIRRYTVAANAMLQEFLEENQEWVKRADGQGKDAIWYEVEVPQLVELGMGDKPIFGDSVTVYMTPAQKVHMYLESKNLDNLRHMTGGRTFVDRELYSKGKRQEALSQGRTIRLVPETVKKLVSDLTQEELELARLLENYYNSFATGEINRVSNILYGYDKAMGKHYAPIYTNRNYTKTEFGVFDVTAEGVGNLKGRQHAVNPSYNISALDAFERHVDQTARFVGMAIPARNWTTLMNWREKNNSTADVITHKWGEESKKYITDLITTLQAGEDVKQDILSTSINKLQSNYISAVFGANPSIVLKQLGSIPLAGAYLGASNVPTPAQVAGIDRKLIEKYTPDLTWRTMGYTTMETKQLKENPNWTQSNKFFRFTFGGGAITVMDGWAASTLWPWAENKVRKDYPELEIGTQEQIDNGESPFYKKVAELFEDAVSRSQSVSDEIHQGRLRKSKNPFTRAFTLFRSDSAQTYNTIRQKIGEAQFLKRSGAKEETQKAARVAIGASVGALLVNALWGETVSFLMALWKNKGKKYRDEDEEMTVGSVLSESVMNILGQLAGVISGGEELFDVIGSILTGEKWYGIDTPGMEQLNDMVETVITAGGNMKGVVAGAVDVLQGGGDLGKYFASKSGALTGVVKDVAEAAGMFLGGLPVGNVEGYLMGLLKWISPELGAGYDDLFSDPGKNELAGLTGDALTGRMQRILDDRGIDCDGKTVAELGALYEAGHGSAFPADVPGSITIKEKTHELSTMQQQTYDRVWSGVVSGALDDLVASAAYREADAKTKDAMLGRLYSYANGRAKEALFNEYDLTDTDAKTARVVAGGIDLASYVAWSTTTSKLKTNEKFAELGEWELNEKAKKALVGSILGTDMKTEAGNPTQYAKFLTAVEGGLSVDEYIDLRADGVEIDKYLKYKDAGLEAATAAALSKTMDALEGEDEDVTDLQKWRAAVDSQADVGDQLAALSVVMTDSQHRKATVANDYKIRPKAWVQVQEMLPRYDADGNGSYKQVEVTAAVDAIGRSMGLSETQKAALWQLVTGSSSAKNNPYNSTVGQQIIDKIDKLKQSDDGNSLSFSDEIARQFAARW